MSGAPFQPEDATTPAVAARRGMETNHAVAVLVVASLCVLVATRRSFRRYIP